LTFPCIKPGILVWSLIFRFSSEYKLLANSVTVNGQTGKQKETCTTWDKFPHKMSDSVDI